jgi:hypothetical protein
VPSMHPDAQLDLHCLLLPLEGGDCDKQESQLKCIWQLLRCGDMKGAQESAVRHKLYWLSSSLLGHSNPFHEYLQAEKENKGYDKNKDNGSELALIVGDGGRADSTACVARRGNVRRPIWLKTCWQYAQKMESNPRNLG